MTLGLWRPNPKKDIPHGPMLDNAGLEDSSADGNFIVNSKKFSNNGKGYNEGQYFIELTVIDNPAWSQPTSTKRLLSSEKGKNRLVKADSVGGRPFGTNFETFARFDLPSCADLQTTHPNPTMTPLTKQGAQAIARKLSVQIMEKNMADRGHPVSLTVSGEDNTVITAESSDFNRASVILQAGNAAYMAPFRKLGFKRIVFTNGSEEWAFDIK